MLRKYLEQNAHGYHSQLAEQGQKLDAELAAWQDLARQYPQSRHALVSLAKHYRTKAQASGNIQYTRQAADSYIRAAGIGLAHGHVRYTREISELLVELGDKTGLDKIFERVLAQPKDLDRDHYYLALVDYANGLALLSEARAWGYFEEAINFHPENNLEAINRYAQHLLIREREQVQKALEVLDTRLTSEQRVRFVLPARLRKQAMEIMGLDTASADGELALIEQRLGQGMWGNAPTTDRSSKVMSTETSIVALIAPRSAIAQAVADDRVSAIFAIPPDTIGTTADERIIKQDAIFSPNGAMNNRWPILLTGRNCGFRDETKVI